MRVIKSFLLTACLGLLFAGPSSFAQQTYTIIDLGTLGGPMSQATAINNLGQVVGHSNPKGSSEAWHAFRTAPNSPINPNTDDLGTLGGMRCFAFDINDLGQVVGQSTTWGDYSPHAFRTAPNSPINPQTDDLSAAEGGFNSVGYAINASGQVVGCASLVPSLYLAPPFHAFRTKPNSSIDKYADDLGTLGGASSCAYGINDVGQAVGVADLATSFAGMMVSHGFRTPADRPTATSDDIGTLGGQFSTPVHINASGQVVGDSDITDILYPSPYHPDKHAFRTAANVPIDLQHDGFGPSASYSGANSINASGQVVGKFITVTGCSQFSAPCMHAFVYTAGSFRDLNDLIPKDSGWELLFAHDINDTGQIVGRGVHNGQSRGFLLTPADDTPPVLDLPADYVAEATGPSGTPVTYSASAEDAVDGAVTVTCDKDSGTLFPLGTTSVHCSATDAHGNVATGTFAVTVGDTTAPTVVIATPLNAAYVLNQSVQADYTCTDITSAAPTCVGTVPNGGNVDTASIGTKNFVVNATDQVGNSASASITYTVRYNVCPLYDPTKAVKGGSTFALKLHLCDFAGVNVSNSNMTVHAISLTKASSSATYDVFDSGNANPDTDFRFDPTLGSTGGYIFNLSTKGFGPGTYLLSITAGADQTPHIVQFQVR